jgi:hypothetical protein
MVSKTEELKISLLMEENISAGIMGLRNNINQLTSSSTQANLEKFKKDQQLVINQMKDLAVSVISGEKAMVSFIGKMGGVGLALTAGGAAMRSFAERMGDVVRLGERLGVPAANIQNVVVQLGQVGVSSDNAKELVVNLTHTLVELGRVGSSQRMALIQASGENVSQMETFIDQVERASTIEEKINRVVEAGRNVRSLRYREAKSMGQSESEARSDAAYHEEKFYQQLHLRADVLERVRGRLAAMTDEQRKRYNDQLKQGEEIEKQFIRIDTSVKQAGNTILLQFGPTAVQALGLVPPALEAIAKGFKAYTDQIDETTKAGKEGKYKDFFLGPDQPATAPKPREGAKGALDILNMTPQQLWNYMMGRTAPPGAAGGDAKTSEDILKSIEENTAEQKKLNENLKTLQEQLDEKTKKKLGAGTGKGAGESNPLDVGGGHAEATPHSDAASSSDFGSEALRSQRQTYLDELSNPAIRKRLFSFQEAEVGGQGNDAAVKWQESLFNRASARSQTLDRALHGEAGKDKGGYWPQRTLNIGDKDPTEEQTASGELALRQTLMGSNRAALATGNASGSVTFAGGPETAQIVSPKGKVQERFGIEGPDVGWAAGTAISMPMIDKPKLGAGVGEGAGKSNPLNIGGGHDFPQGGPYAGRPSPAEVDPNNRVLQALDEARQIVVATGGNEDAVKKYINKQGINVDSAWCGDFTAATLKKANMKPVKDYPLASNWRNYGVPIDAPMPGDIAIKKTGRASTGNKGQYVPTGEAGSHVGLVSNVNAEGFTMEGGNQGGQLFRARNYDEYEYRRPIATAVDRSQIDVATQQRGGEVNLNQSGKVTANVSAPMGTKVTVESGGVFDKTETNRTPAVRQGASVAGAGSPL